MDKNTDQIAAEAADNFLDWRDGKGQPRITGEREQLIAIIKSDIIEKAREAEIKTFLPMVKQEIESRAAHASEGADVIVSDYKRHLEAAMLAGETCSCCDVKYLTDLLSVVLSQRPTPATASEQCGCEGYDKDGKAICTAKPYKPAHASEQGADLWHLLEVAWGVIANASGGNWENEPVEWEVAATRWRDDYHKALSQRPTPATSSEHCTCDTASEENCENCERVATTHDPEGVPLCQECAAIPDTEWECPDCKTRYVSNVGKCGSLQGCSRPQVQSVFKPDSATVSDRPTANPKRWSE